MSGVSEMPHPKRLIDPRDGLITTPWRSWFDAVRKRLVDRKKLRADLTPTEIAAGDVLAVDVTGADTGIKPGMVVSAAYSEPLTGVVLLATVKDVDAVTVVFWNITASPVTPDPGEVTVRVEVN